ncbi:MAG TPA: hypothetical protein ENN30_02750 [Candidatus Woesearchaeota archaeon]|nr:hypothetical protein [Candidatus Woesearchaeota archaeon]
MSGNKKSQAMVVDLILLVIIAGFFFLFLSQQAGGKSIMAESIRSQSGAAERTLISILNYRMKEGDYLDSTIAETIAAYHCRFDQVNKRAYFLNETINELMNNFSKKGELFIFVSHGADRTTFACSPEVEALYGGCCVKTESITISLFEMDLPCNDTVKIELGMWPASMKVQRCD